MTEKQTLESWEIKVVLQNPQRLVVEGAARPEGYTPPGYTQADVDTLIRVLRDDREPMERRLVDAVLKDGQIEAWLTAGDAKPIRCGELADLCARALPLCRPEYAYCVESRRVVTEVGWLAS